MKIRELDKEARNAVYENHMKKDFPPAELKPLSSIESMQEEGCYLCTGLYDDDGTMVAYAFFVVAETVDSLLLDYLAVCEGGRGKGYGGIYMKLMKEYFSGKDGILIECESVESAQKGEKEIRQRRIRFYEKSGAVKIDSMSNLFGVEYSVLYFPVGKEVEAEQAHKALKEIYGKMFPEKYRDRVRLWRI